jgi:hypothetical protein
VVEAGGYTAPLLTLMSGYGSIRVRNWAGGAVGGYNPNNQTLPIISWDSTGVTLGASTAVAGSPVTGTMTLDANFGPTYAQSPRTTRFDIRNFNVAYLIQKEIAQANGGGTPQNFNYGGYLPLSQIDSGAYPYPQYFENWYVDQFPGSSDPNFVTRMEPMSRTTLTGTVDVSSGNATITGTGTAFTTALPTTAAACTQPAVGKYVTVGGVDYVVLTNADNTHITVSPTPAVNLSGATMQRVDFDWRCYNTGITVSAGTTQISGDNQVTGTRMFATNTLVSGCMQTTWSGPEFLINGGLNSCAPPDDFMPLDPNGGGLGVAGMKYFSPLERVEF